VLGRGRWTAIVYGAGLAQGCGGGASFVSVNEAPSIGFVGPTVDDVLVEGDRVVLEAWVEDETTPAGDLVVSVVSTIQGPLADPMHPAADGAVFLRTDPLLAGEHALTVAVSDPMGATAAAYATLTVLASTPPVATLLSPLPGGLYYDALDLLLEGVVADGESAGPDLVAWWDVDGNAYDSSVPDGEGRTWFLLPPLTAGDHSVRLWVIDEAGQTDVAEAGIRVLPCADLDGDGADCHSDCDDSDPFVGPSTSEACNGIDDDCDGDVDEGFLPGSPDCP